MSAHAANLHRPSLLGVLYAEDFDEDGSAPAAAHTTAELEVIDPVFTAAELDAARAEARQAGRAEAEHGLAGSRNHMLSVLVAGLSDARESARAVAETVADGTAQCILSALAACLPALCEQHGAAELRALVRALLPALSQEPRVTVRVNPHMLSAMQAEIATLDTDAANCVHLIPTDAVPPGDARIGWADGSVVRDAARARAAFQDGLALLGLLQREREDA